MNSSVFVDLIVQIAKYTTSPLELLFTCKSVGLRNYFKELHNRSKYIELSIYSKEIHEFHYIYYRIICDIYYRYMSGPKLQAFVLKYQYKGPMTYEDYNDLLKDISYRYFTDEEIFGKKIYVIDEHLEIYSWCNFIDILWDNDFYDSFPYSDGLVDYISRKWEEFANFTSDVKWPKYVYYCPYVSEKPINLSFTKEYSVIKPTIHMYKRLNGTKCQYSLIKYCEDLGKKIKFSKEQLALVYDHWYDIHEEFLEKWAD